MNWNLGKHKVAWQAVFWLAHILLASMLYTGVLSFKEAVPRGLEQSIFHAIIVYGNLFGIYPYFLKKRGGVLSYLCVGLLFSALIALCQFNLFAPIIKNSFLGIVEGKWHYLIRGTSIFFSVFLLTMLYQLLLDWSKSKQTEVKLRNEQLETELKFLKAQVNPHFLFNTLNNIYTLCLLKDGRSAPMVMKLSEMMRYLLHDSQTAQISIEKEIQFLEGFIALQKLKTDWEPNITFKITGSLKGVFLPPLLFISFFENLSKHSDLDTNPEAWASIILDIQPKQITFKMENTVRQATSLSVQSGLGLRNTKQRLELIYPDRHTFRAEMSSEFTYGATVIIQI